MFYSNVSFGLIYVNLFKFLNKKTKELHPETHKILDEAAKIIKEGNIEAWIDFDKSKIVKDIDEYIEVKDTLDVWFDSGVTHQTVLKERGINNVADLYLEGSDQHRGWFQSSLITSHAMFKKSPYKNVLTSKFGYRRGGFHKGIDIRLAKGTNVKAAFNGKVRYARYNNGGYGNLVIIRHFNGLETYYAHLSKILVKENDIIQSGKGIGLGGKTGVEWSGTHLHFEVRYRDLSFDPLKIISLENECLLSDSILLKKVDFHPTIQSQRKYHKIKSGETLSHLARRHNTSVSKILKLNKELTINSTLRIGQRIRVR